MKHLKIETEVLVKQTREYELPVPDDFPTDLESLTDEQLEYLHTEIGKLDESVTREDYDVEDIINITQI